MPFNFQYGAKALGQSLPAIERAAYDTGSFSAALELQKVQRANQQMDLDNARQILQIRDSRVRRDLEQQRYDQHERSQAIAWRNQIASMGGRVLPADQQPNADDIVQVDPYTGERFAYKNLEVAKREQMIINEENKYREAGFIEGTPPMGAVTVTLPDKRQMYKPVTSYDLTKGAGMANYFSDTLKAFQGDEANLQAWADKEYNQQLANYRSYAATTTGKDKAAAEARIAAMEGAKEETLARFKKEEKDRLGRAFTYWSMHYDKPVNLKDVPPEFMPYYAPDPGTPVAEAVQRAPVQFNGFVAMREPTGDVRLRMDEGKGNLNIVVPPERAAAATLAIEHLVVNAGEAAINGKQV